MTKRIFALSVAFVLIFAGCSEDNDNSENDNNPPQEGSYFPVVVEEFSHTDCVPCVNVSNAVQTVMENYEEAGAVPILIEFHPKPEGFGADPFHDENPDLHDGRMAWYFDYFGLENLPQLLVDAQPLSAMERNDPDVIYQKIEGARSTAKPVSIEGYVLVACDSVRIALSFRADSTVSANIFCFLVRDEVEFSEAPGSNGMTQFHHIAAEQFPIDSAVVSVAWDSLDIETLVPLPPDIEGATVSGYSVVVIVQDGERNILGAALLPVEMNPAL